MFYHVTINLESVLEMPDKELTGMLTFTGEPLAPDQVRVAAEYYLNKGLVCLPTCEHTDARGMCLGHEE